MSAGPAELARAVIGFWCDELSPELHWKKDPVVDRHIAMRFGTLRKTVLDSRAAGWRETPETLAAAIILTDQFSRNIFRGSAKAYEADALALELAKLALERGWVGKVEPALRPFLLMPLMHSEKIADQDRSVDEFRKLGAENNVRFAILHHDQLKRFGRFPGRNAALGRRTTEAEQAALDAGAAF